MAVSKKKAVKVVKEAKPMGRPSKYSPEYCEQVEKLCKLGATDKEIAEFFNVCEDTVNEWKNVYDDFSVSIKKGKLLADANIADSLYHRAKGYKHPDVDIKMYEGQIIETELVKHYPPDTAAAIFWLKNRQRNKWRDKQDHEVTGKDGKDLYPDKSEEEIDQKIKEYLKDRK